MGGFLVARLWRHRAWHVPSLLCNYYTTNLKKCYNNFWLLPRKEVEVMAILLRRILFAVTTGIVAGIIANAIYALLAG